jgi:hypothetical protein
MPTIYRVICERCATEEPTLGIEGGCAGRVIHDGGGEKGILTQGWYWAVVSTEASLVPLRHPIESSILAEQRMTFFTAGIRGRLVYVQQFACDDCGTLYEVAKQRFFSPATTCLSTLGLGACLFWLSQSHGRSTAAIVSATLMAAVAVLPIVGTWIVRVVYRPLAAGLPSGSCPECGSARRVALDSNIKKRLPCPRCGTRSVTVEMAGIS